MFGYHMHINQSYMLFIMEMWCNSYYCSLVGDIFSSLVTPIKVIVGLLGDWKPLFPCIVMLDYWHMFSEFCLHFTAKYVIFSWLIYRKSALNSSFYVCCRLLLKLV